MFAYFKSAIDIACELKAQQVVVTSGWAFYNEQKEEAWGRSVRMLRQVAEYARQRGMYLAIEALQKDESVLVNTCEDLQRMLRDVGNDHLKVCLDMGAMAGAGEDVRTYFQTFGNDVIHCHFVDGKPVGHLAWGDGNRDMKADLEVFKTYGYQGYLSLESANLAYFKEPAKADHQSKVIFTNTIKELGV